MLEEEVFVDQQEEFEKPGNESKVCLLKKALYGLKQAPKAWYSRVDDYFLSLGFKRSLSEPTLYVKSTNNELLIVSLYVDDLLVTSSCKNQIVQFKLQMMEEFQMSDLGEMAYFLGMEINQMQQGIFVCQQKYTAEILKKFDMQNCKPISTPLVQNAKLSRMMGLP